MKKILTLFLIVSAGVCFAEKCTYCPATMGVRIVNGRPYCGKHYCSKHKEIHSEDKCYRCDLQSRLSRGKAKCAFCNNTKKLTIAKGNRKYEAFCPDHYCTTHKNAFYEPYSGSPYCLKCRQEASAKEEAEKKIKHAEALEAEADKLEARIQELKAQRAASHKLRAEPLTGLFGVELDAPITSIVSKPIPEDPNAHSFTPAKRFRDFKLYAVQTSENRIFAIRTARYFNVDSDAENEFENVVGLLDKKYNRERRTDVLKHGLYDKKVEYSFGCDEATGLSPKQKIVVAKIRSGMEYEVSIYAYVVADVKKMLEDDAKNDMDAL